VNKRRSKHVKIGSEAEDFGGASFDPAGSHFAIAGVSLSGGAELFVIDVSTGARKHVAHTAAPIWGPQGLAFSATGRLQLLRRLDGPKQTLFNRESQAIDWSGNGNRLLAFRRHHRTLHTLLIDLMPRHVTRIDEPLVPTDLSSDGTQILGTEEGNVVVRRASGVPTVLAAGAQSPSWTK
jgi:Tol biopolymer transport system component